MHFTVQRSCPQSTPAAQVPVPPQVTSHSVLLQLILLPHVLSAPQLTLQLDAFPQLTLVHEPATSQWISHGTSSGQLTWATFENTQLSLASHVPPLATQSLETHGGTGGASTTTQKPLVQV